ncbi:MAG: RHS repeat domain-containing protein [Methylocella sp.]
MPFGMASGWTAGNGASYQRTIDLDGRITGLALPGADTIALTYDAASRITRIKESGLPKKAFGYDALNRLTDYASGAATQTYTYDADGNRASYAANGTSPVSLTYSYGKASNRLHGIGGSWTESFTYDANGNMLSHSSPSADYSYEYDARNRLVLSSSGAIGTTELINGLGQRTGKIGEDQPTLFAYDEAGHLTGQYNSTGGLAEETVWLGDLPVAVLSPAGQFYVAPDHLGAPHQITNASGAVVWFWDHDPFGNGLPTNAAGFAYNLRFPGQFYDARAKLHYNYFRDYDPNTGRYIESDPIGLAGGIYTYAYAGGNPVTRIDPLGTDCNRGELVTLTFDAVSELISELSNIEVDYINGPVEYIYQFGNTLASQPQAFGQGILAASQWNANHPLPPTGYNTDSIYRQWAQQSQQTAPELELNSPFYRFVRWFSSLGNG